MTAPSTTARLRSDPLALAQAVRAGERRALALAITLVESSRPDHRRQAESLLMELAHHAGASTRIGISGMPGVGKSSFIERFGNDVLDRGHRLAVLSVDPSSAISGGSILGDKTRMEMLARREAAYIRPSPAGRTLGGVARRTRESISICEAAGFDLVIIETVGVGQSESAVADMTDLFVLMLLPGSGDELQGIKRGVMELADVLLVNKSDGELEPTALRTVAEYQHALRLLQPRSKNWSVPVLPCSAHEGLGIAETWEVVDRFQRQRRGSGEFQARRASQARSWLWSETAEILLSRLRAHSGVRDRLLALEAKVAACEMPASVAAAQLASAFVGHKAATGSTYQPPPVTVKE